MKQLVVFILLLIAFSTNAQQLNSASFHNHRRSLKNSFLKFQNETTGRVVFLGGSITFNTGWRDSVSNYLREKFPETDFDFINAGIPSMGTTPGAFRFRRDALKNGPVDLLFVEAAVNDAANQRSAAEITRGMEGIVRHALHANAQTDIVMMHFADPGKLNDYGNDKVPEVIQLHEDVAIHYEISSINLAKEVHQRITEKEFDWENDFKDLHPSPFGQSVYFRSIKAFLKDEWNQDFSSAENAKREIPQPIDRYAYSNGVLIEPDPPKPIAGWEMVTKWYPETPVATRFNYVDMPMLVGTYPGEVIKFPFKGNAVGIAVAAGPDAGIIEFSIDNSAWQQADLFTAWSENLHLPWYYTLASGLKNRRHMLQIRMADDKNPRSTGKVCRLRYFYFNAPE